MTTLAKIEANQRNSQLSTGPRTDAGKALVAQNATRHGIFSSVPVIPGECPDVWEAHRAGVVESLAPVGLLEVNLAERAALLLWRLQRLARYEAETVAAAMEAGLDAALATFLAEGPTEIELARARTRLVAETIFARDSQSSLARIFGSALAVGETVEDVLAWPQRIEAVGRDAVVEAARRYLKPDRSVTGLLLPA